MFICQQCNIQVPPHIPLNLIPLQTRNKKYPARANVNREVHSAPANHKNDPGGSGTEIVQEIRVCPDCYAKLKTKLSK
ncbi:hypothetical protein [Thiofilum flexile]|uniref:hypothetical protein n=1 Tax=Thiofilum flexile TaxID=125627 RepID=UPI0003A5600F|nr:hypothetical protein [Thiofilum flexile]